MMSLCSSVAGVRGSGAARSSLRVTLLTHANLRLQPHHRQGDQRHHRIRRPRPREGVVVPAPAAYVRHALTDLSGRMTRAATSRPCSMPRPPTIWPRSVPCLHDQAPPGANEGAVAQRPRTTTDDCVGVLRLQDAITPVRAERWLPPEVPH